MLAELPPELLAILVRFLPFPDLFFTRLLCRSIFQAASHELFQRAKYYYTDRLPREFSSAIWAIRADGIRRSRIDSPVEAFSVGRLLGQAGLRPDSLVTMSVIECLTADSAATPGDVLAGLGTTRADLDLVLQHLLLLPCAADFDGDDLALLLRRTRLPNEDLAAALYCIQVRFSVKWQAISLLENWRDDLAREKALRTRSVAGLVKMHASALGEMDDEAEVLLCKLFSNVGRSGGDKGYFAHSIVVEGAWHPIRNIP
jgi:hypothetical protein